MFHGSLVAIITPMNEDKTIDFISLEKLIEWHIENHTDGIVILGTTGESATIIPEERVQIIKKVNDQVADRVPVIAGTGTNSTTKTIQLTREAMEIGVDACLVVTPYYNKPTQEGLYLHYKSVAEMVAIPLILYNIPSRTGCDLLPETVIRLAKVPNVIGLKEGTGDIERVKTILDATNGKLDLYSGDDETALEFIRAGGKGVISVTANVAPKEMSEFCKAILSGNLELARSLNHKLMPLHQKLFVETNPIPVKWALHELNKVPQGIRLPLTLLSEKNRAVVKNAMLEAGIS